LAVTAHESSLFFPGYADPRDLHSFPTRRSSDLRPTVSRSSAACWSAPKAALAAICSSSAWIDTFTAGNAILSLLVKSLTVLTLRSEEHTSELQSRGHLVCRLLLEKKNISREN